jgi:CDP-glucose 4,6-dehydratase
MADQSLAGKRILVTGATGLIGSALTRRLLEMGASVVAVLADTDPLSPFYRDGTAGRCRIFNGRLERFGDVVRAVTEGEVEGIFHLGAQTIVTTALAAPMQTFEANIRGTYNLLEAARMMGERIGFVIVASTDKAYGPLMGEAYTEDMPLAGRGPYDVSKSCCDLLAQSYWHTWKMPVCVTRCANVFGPGDMNWSRIIPGTIQAALQDRPVVLRSDGSHVREYIYVEDIAEAYLHLAAAMGRQEIVGEAFNFCPARCLSVLEIVREVLAVMGREDLEPVIANTARAEIPIQKLDGSKANRLLGWSSRWEMSDALAETVKWYRQVLA